MSFGQFLKKERKERGMSQRLLAQLIDTSNTEISRIEQEIRQKPSPVMLKKISEVMEIPLDTLMREAGYTPQSTQTVQSLQAEKSFLDILSTYLEKNSWSIKRDYMTHIGQYRFAWDCVANNSSNDSWFFEFMHLHDDQKSTSSSVQVKKLFSTLGLAATDPNVTRLSFVFNNNNFFEQCKEIIPFRLGIDVSLILIDFEKGTVSQEVNISR